MQIFSTAGWVKRIVMGLDKVKRTPCGFCFVEYYTREDAADAVKYINGAQLDERPIRVDFDWGFQEGRQYGRGRGGGQVCAHAWLMLAMQAVHACAAAAVEVAPYGWMLRAMAV